MLIGICEDNPVIREELIQEIQKQQTGVTIWQRQIRKFLCKVRCNLRNEVAPFPFVLMLQSGSPAGLSVFLPS